MALLWYVTYVPGLIATHVLGLYLKPYTLYLIPHTRIINPYKFLHLSVHKSIQFHAKFRFSEPLDLNNHEKYHASTKIKIMDKYLYLFRIYYPEKFDQFIV
jgi:hypothetical protein